MKYEQKTTEARLGYADANGQPIDPKPPDDSGAWQLRGTASYWRQDPPTTLPGANINTIYLPVHSLPYKVVQWYWERAIDNP